MSYDFGYGQFVPSRTPYKTIASNPLFMSFAEPSPPETGHVSKSTAQPDSNVSSPFDDLTFGQWSGQTSTREGSSHTGSLDELFGGHIFDSQSPINFNVLMKSAAASPISPVLPPSMSPVVHQFAHTPPSAPSSNASPRFESPGSSPTVGSRPNPNTCPKTRAQMEQHIQAEGSSIFAPPPSQEKEAQSQIFRSPAGADGPPMIMRKGATFPPTEKSEHNIDALTAWQSITSHPHFQASVSDHVLRVEFI
jgi:AP-1-like factor